MPDRRTFLSNSAAALAGVVLSHKTSFGQSTNNLAFTGGNWFDGRGFRRHAFYSHAGVLTSRKPAGAIETIDLKNWFIVPPFGEAHNHNVDFSSEEQWAGIKQMYLRAGIFYAKNPMNLKRAATPLAGRINIPSSLDVVFAPAGLTVTDGHPMGLIKRNIEHGGMLPSDIDGGFAWLIDTQDDLERKWPRIIAEKPDFIKTILVYSEEYEKRRNDPKYFSWKGLNPALLPEIARRAHRAGLRVSTHVESAMDFHHAVNAGVDEVNHLPGFRPENNDFAKGYMNLDRYRITEADARAAAQRKISVVLRSGLQLK